MYTNGANSVPPSPPPGCRYNNRFHSLMNAFAAWRYIQEITPEGPFNLIMLEDLPYRYDPNTSHVRAGVFLCGVVDFTWNHFGRTIFIVICLLLNVRPMFHIAPSHPPFPCAIFLFLKACLRMLLILIFPSLVLGGTNVPWDNAQLRPALLSRHSHRPPRAAFHML